MKTKKDFQMQLQENIHQVLEEAGFSKEKFAKSLGVTKNTLLAMLNSKDYLPSWLLTLGIITTYYHLPIIKTIIGDGIEFANAPFIGIFDETVRKRPDYLESKQDSPIYFAMFRDMDSAKEIEKSMIVFLDHFMALMKKEARKQLRKISKEIH